MDQLMARTHFFGSDCCWKEYKFKKNCACDLSSAFLVLVHNASGVMEEKDLSKLNVWFLCEMK